MEYISVRMVQQFCTQGRVPGARKLGRYWAIPADAEKPLDPRIIRKHGAGAPTSGGLINYTNLMPLMNTAFPPGQCLTAAEAMVPGPQRDIAQAEYYYFTGKPEMAAKEVEPYLTSPDMAARLSAYLIYAYANLPMGQIQRTRFALGGS